MRHHCIHAVLTAVATLLVLILPETPALSAEETTPVQPKTSAISQYYAEYQVVNFPARQFRQLKEEATARKTGMASVLKQMYASGKVRVLSSASGFLTTNSETRFRLVRMEYYPINFILPNPRQTTREELPEDFMPVIPGPIITDKEEPITILPYSNQQDAEEEDYTEEDSEAEEDEEEEDEEEFFYNNLRTVFPVFAQKPSLAGNDFSLKLTNDGNVILADLQSQVKKSNGNSMFDFGKWGEGLIPTTENNSFSDVFRHEEGTIALIGSASTGGANMVMHIFYLKKIPLENKALRARGDDVPLKITTRVVRIARTDYMNAAAPDKNAADVPDGELAFGKIDYDIYAKISKFKSFMELSTSTFSVMSGKEAYSADNLKKMMFARGFILSENPGTAALPAVMETMEDGATLEICPQLMDDGATARVNWHYRKVTQQGWRNYGYEYEPDPNDASDGGYAQIRMPLFEENEAKQTMYIPVGKDVPAAKISNPAFQPDMLTLYFVRVDREEVKQSTITLDDLTANQQTASSAGSMPTGNK